MSNNTLAVVSQSGQTLNLYDLESQEKTGQLSGLIAEPHELAYDARTNLLYSSHAYEHGMYGNHGEYSHQITVVDCEGEKRIVDTIDISPMKGPHYLLINDHRDILYASVEYCIPETDKGGGIIGIDLKNRKVIRAIGSDYHSHWFVMTPDGTKAYTCNKEADFISVIDLVKEKMVGRISMEGGCEQPGISKNGRWAYFPTPSITFRNPEHPCIKVIDTTINEVVKSIPMDLGVVTIHVDSQDRLLVCQYLFGYVGSSPKASPMNGRLLVLSSKDNDFRVLASMEVEKVPLTIFSTPDGRTAFVSNISSGTVSIVDLTAMEVGKTLQVDTASRADQYLHQGAHGLALVP